MKNWLTVFSMTSQSTFCAMAAMFSFVQLNHSKFSDKLKKRGALLKFFIVCFTILLSTCMAHPAWTRTSLLFEADRPVCTIKNWDEVQMEDWEKLLLAENMPNDDEVDDVIASSGSYDYDEIEYEFECKLQGVGANFMTWYAAMIAVIYVIPVLAFALAFCRRKKWSPSGRWLLGNSLAHATTWLPSNLYKVAKIGGIGVGPNLCEAMQDVTFVFGYLSCLAIPSVMLAYTVKLKGNNDKEKRKKVEEKLMSARNNYTDSADVVI